MILDLWSLKVKTSSRIIVESDRWIQSFKKYNCFTYLLRESELALKENQKGCGRRVFQRKEEKKPI